MNYTALLCATLLVFLTGCASSTRPGAIGVNREQFLIVPASTVEQMALTSYLDQNKKAKTSGKLLDKGPEYSRLQTIAGRLIPQTKVFRDDALNWKWHLTLINAPVLNATCAPGGKITFYTGIIRQLKLTNNEIAAVMGHEIAHALREHGREKISKAMGQQLVLGTALAATGTAQYSKLANQAANVMYTLPNSREAETEADVVGLELMARAGYDPAAAINVWKKMTAASEGKEPTEFFSTHPSHATRIQELTELQGKVKPLYDAAEKPPPEITKKGSSHKSVQKDLKIR